MDETHEHTWHGRNQNEECTLYGSIYIKFSRHNGGCGGGSGQKGVVMPLSADDVLFLGLLRFSWVYSVHVIS